MFDSNSSIRMLELVLCLGRDGAQDPGFCLFESRLRFVDYYDHYMTHSLDGCDHAWVYLSILTGWLHPYLGSRLLCTLLWMTAPIPHISCTWDISCTSLCRFSGGSVFSYACSCKAFHPSLSLGPHALGGICYTVICHRLSPSLLPLSCTLEDSFRDLWEVTWPETTCIIFL